VIGPGVAAEELVENNPMQVQQMSARDILLLRHNPQLRATAGVRFKKTMA